MHRQALLDPASGMSHAVRSVIEGGLDIAAVRYIEALSLRTGLLQNFVDKLLGDCDLLMLPVSLPSAPAFTPADTLQGAEVDRVFSQTATMTRFANYLGLPAISLPSGLASNGLPSAIQLLARPFEESLLLSSAAHFEALRGASTYPDLN
jgi:aspartyl-tRNA(Asn)/glutamyl-tRNA(Gln) amidotransferase subunit A